MRKKVGLICLFVGVAMLVAALSLFAYNQWDDWRAGQASEEALLQAKTAAESAQEEEALSAEYAGILTIPALDLELPVLDTCSAQNLKTAPCRYFGSVQEKNLVIAGHSYRRHFGTLSRLQSGDDVIFTDSTGQIWLYTVASTESLSANASEQMISGEFPLTLFTCDYSGSRRIAVRCVQKTAS